MPIIVSQELAKASNPIQYDPKFFSKILTGNGKRASGLLQKTVDPINQKSRTEHHDAICDRVMEQTSGNVTTTTLPMLVMTQDVIKDLHPAQPFNLDNPGTTQLVSTSAIGKDGKTHNVDLVASLDIVQTIVRKTKDTSNKNKASTDVEIRYNVKLIAVADPTSKTAATIDTFAADNMPSSASSPMTSIIDPDTGTVRNAQTVVLGAINPAYAMSRIVAAMKLSGLILPDMIDDWLDDVHAADIMTIEAEHWNLNAAEDINHVIDAAIKAGCAGSTGSAGTDPKHIWKLLSHQFTHLMDYPMGLNAYIDIYNALATKMNTHIFGAKMPDYFYLANMNINLLLSRQLEALHRLKPRLEPVPGPNTNVTLPDWLNAEQRAAITTTDPLTLVQSGAGTGKSSMINALIDYYIATGIEPQDITAISFTNAAADHLKELQPKLHSFTIASMVHEIYELNWPKQTLSNMETLINTIRIYHGNDPFAHAFTVLCERMLDDESDLRAKTEMNNFIEANFDQVISLLDSIGQSALGLETMICYQAIDRIQEPDDVLSKHLIIDEVQDNSIFEFVFILKYIAKHMESLFLVGDASQSLYEFRGSNPKALNMLEATGIFKTFRLDTNYRSNQEVLDMANMMLDDIETNRFAGIHLESAISPSTKLDTFLDKIHIAFQPSKTPELPKATDIHEHIDDVFTKNGVWAFIEQCMKQPQNNANGGSGNQQVAILAYQRRVASAIEAACNERWPNKSVVQLTSARGYTSTVFSKYLERFGRDLNYMPTDAIIQSIRSAIINHLPYLIYGNVTKATPTIEQMMERWIDATAGQMAALQVRLKTGSIDKSQFIAAVRKMMLEFEIADNQSRVKFLRQSNAEKKVNDAAQKADIIVSTIHGVKGLEFDNTVVMVQENTKAMDEDTKRMYYVALTRAKGREFIMAYGSADTSTLEAYWLEHAKALYDTDVQAGLTPAESLERVWKTIHGTEQMPQSWADAIRDAQLAVASNDNTD